MQAGTWRLLLLLLSVSAVRTVLRPIKIAALFDHNTNMRHDVMFENAIKATIIEDHESKKLTLFFYYNFVVFLS